MTDPVQWQCPYCGHWQVISTENHQTGTIPYSSVGYTGFVQNSEYGNVGLYAKSTACINPDCKKLALEVSLVKIVSGLSGTHFRLSPHQKSWSLLPESMAKPQPDYIPDAIRQDYEEACRILSLSPKASATLARRCLQGMIRDFCGITERTLNAEIETLKKRLASGDAPEHITSASITAIDNARKIGNIGAHMKIERDVIVDVEPDESALLIQLIEALLKLWYVARHDVQKGFEELNAVIEKKEQKSKDATEDE